MPLGIGRLAGTAFKGSHLFRRVVVFDMMPERFEGLLFPTLLGDVDEKRRFVARGECSERKPGEAAKT